MPYWRGYLLSATPQSLCFPCGGYSKPDLWQQSQRKHSNTIFVTSLIFFPYPSPYDTQRTFFFKKNLAFKKVSLKISRMAYLWDVREHSLAIRQFTAKENSNWVLLLLLFGVTACAVGCEQTGEDNKDSLLRFIRGILRTKSTLSCLEAKPVQLACLWLAKDTISLWLDAA